MHASLRPIGWGSASSAAHWYTQRYPDALIASLDSGLARQWLSLQAPSRERADLIGLREDEQGSLVIDVIEVKAVENASKEVQVAVNPQTRQPTLSGPAIEQLRATLAAIVPIFALREGEHGLFTQARREALKYQLYRECFRELHENADQFRWYRLLNRAFGVDRLGGPVTVSCRGLVIHTHFEDHGDTDMVSDSIAPITLVRLRDQAIQRLVGAEELGGTPPAIPPTPLPSPPPPPDPDRGPPTPTGPSVDMQPGSTTGSDDQAVEPAIGSAQPLVPEQDRGGREH